MLPDEVLEQVLGELGPQNRGYTYDLLGYQAKARLACTSKHMQSLVEPSLYASLMTSHLHHPSFLLAIQNHPVRAEFVQEVAWTMPAPYEFIYYTSSDSVEAMQAEYDGTDTEALKLSIRTRAQAENYKTVEILSLLPRVEILDLAIGLTEKRWPEIARVTPDWMLEGSDLWLPSPFLLSSLPLCSTLKMLRISHATNFSRMPSLGRFLLAITSLQVLKIGGIPLEHLFLTDAELAEIVGRLEDLSFGHFRTPYHRAVNQGVARLINEINRPLPMLRHLTLDASHKSLFFPFHWYIGQARQSFSGLSAPLPVQNLTSLSLRGVSVVNNFTQDFAILLSQMGQLQVLRLDFRFFQNKPGENFVLDRLPDLCPKLISVHISYVMLGLAQQYTVLLSSSVNIAKRSSRLKNYRLVCYISPDLMQQAFSLTPDSDQNTVETAFRDSSQELRNASRFCQITYMYKPVGSDKQRFFEIGGAELGRWHGIEN